MGRQKYSLLLNAIELSLGFRNISERLVQPEAVLFNASHRHKHREVI